MTSIYKIAAKFEKKIALAFGQREKINRQVTPLDKDTYQQIQQLVINVHDIPIKIISNYLTYLSNPKLEILESADTAAFINQMEELRLNVNDYFDTIRRKIKMEKFDHLKKVRDLQRSMMNVNKKLYGLRDEIKGAEEYKKIPESSKKTYVNLFPQIDKAVSYLQKSLDNCNKIAEGISAQGDIMPVISPQIKGPATGEIEIDELPDQPNVFAPGGLEAYDQWLKEHSATYPRAIEPSSKAVALPSAVKTK